MNNQTIDDMTGSLSAICDFLNEMEIDAELYPAGQQFPLPSLIIWADGPKEQGGQVIINNYVPIDANAESTNFMQFYIEFPIDLGGIGEADLLRELDLLNRALPMGHAMTVAPRPDMTFERMAGARYMFGVSDSEPIDGDVYLEMLMMFSLSCEAIRQKLDELTQ